MHIKDVNHFARLSVSDFLKELDVDNRGLFQDEVKKRHEQYGLNKIETHALAWWHLLLRQFTSSFVYLLLGAAVISMLLGELHDGILIFFFVLLNAGVGFYQEYHSEQTLKLLKKYIVAKSRVMRCAKEEEIPSSELVPGDVLILQAGDIIPADIRLIDSQGMTVDESTLTGESVPIEKISTPSKQEIKNVYNAENIVFSGTSIVSGKGMGVVIATGRETMIGGITTLTVETRKVTSYEKGVQKFSKFILFLVVITLAGIFILNIIIKGSNVNIPDLLVFSVALAVSAIPEALGVVLTFSLSHGAIRLAKKKVVMKRLSAIEDLGNIEILCTDKTGTLTENVLTKDAEFNAGKESAVLFAALGTTLEEKKNHSIHSFDTALLDSLTQEEKKEFASYKRLEESPFDPVKKRNSVVVFQDGEYHVVVRGAVEEILKLCPSLDLKEKREVDAWIREQGFKRILAVATKKITKYTHGQSVQNDGELTFVGMVSFIDPIKKTACEAVKKAEDLDVIIKILTGDSREVAGHVAYQIGIISDETAVITGEELERMSEPHQREAVKKYHVFARVSPEQKYTIIKLLQKDKEVGFLGEGINDSPALKIANVAMVVDGATDIARETADIILLKKSLLVIVEGIIEGRRTFVNCMKYIRATLSSNFGNFYTVAITSLFLPFLPLLPLQILLLNLITDFPMIAVASDNVDMIELKHPKKYDMHEIAFLGTILGVVSASFDFMYVAYFSRYSPSELQTYWFMGSVMTELLFLFSIRTRLPILKAIPASRTIYGLTIIIFATTFILPFTSVGHSFFSFTSPGRFELCIVVLLAIVYFIVTELVKNMYYRFAIHKIRFEDI